jgi:hypothetical protein
MLTGLQVTIADGGQTLFPARRQFVFVFGNKVIHRAIWMILLPFGIHVVDHHATSASTKNPEKRVVGHMSCYAAQRRALQATLCVGGLSRHEACDSTGKETADDQSFHHVPLSAVAAPEPSRSAFLIHADQAAEPSHVGGKDRGQSAHDVLICHLGADAPIPRYSLTGHNRRILKKISLM